MKNKLTKILAMTLIFCMLFTMAGCTSSNEDPLVGTWKSEWDLASYMNEMMMETGIETDFEDLVINVELEIKDDETYELTVDKDSVEDMVDEFFTQFEGVTKDVLEQTAEEYGMTLDELMEQSGYDSFDEYYEDATAEMDVQELVGEIDVDAKGAYKFEDDKLWLADGDEIDEESYYEVKLEEDTLTWEAAFGEEEEMSEYLLPLEFEKK